MLWDTLLKSYWIYVGGKKSEGASKGVSNSNNNPVLGKGLFTEAFYKCFFSGNTLYTIKGVNRLVYLSLVVGIAILGL